MLQNLSQVIRYFSFLFVKWGWETHVKTAHKNNKQHDGGENVAAIREELIKNKQKLPRQCQKY